MSTEAKAADRDWERRTEQALEWFSRHERGDELSIPERERWHAWIVDGHHSAEFDGFVSTYWQLQAIPRPPLPSDSELHASVARERGQHSLVPSTSPAQSWGSSVRLRYAAKGFVCAAVIALLMFLYRISSGGAAVDSNHIYATAPGEQREFRLVDGSAVTLGADSRLTITLSPAQRLATLGRGEARFRVRHDRQRPFIVFAGLGTITAVGTIFDVRRYSDHVFVAVTDGAVEVAQRMQPARGAPPSLPASREDTTIVPLRVARGQELTYDVQGNATAVQPTDIRSAESWTYGLLTYGGRPLGEVIEDVQRYSSRHIVLDPTVANMKYTGNFVPRNLEQWLRGLTRIFPVEVVETDADHIVIRFRSREDHTADDQLRQ